MPTNTASNKALPTASFTTRGITTWNDEMSFLLAPSSPSGQPNVRRIKCRDHLGRLLTPTEFSDAFIALGFGSQPLNVPAVCALLDSLKTGSTLDQRVDDIKTDITNTGGSLWTLALISDRHVNGSIEYIFEVYKEN